VAARIALIHTVRSVLESFEPQLRAALPPGLRVHNLLDDFLASDPAETGVFSEVNRQRLANDLRNAELTGAELIAVTCSTLSPPLASLRDSFATPIVAIDDALFRQAVRMGPRILVLATARSTVEPTLAGLRREAGAAGRSLALDYRVADEAYAAIKSGDRDRHDLLVEELVRDLRAGGGDAPAMDLIVLAQASMAHLEARIAGICRCPVLSSPALCIAEIRDRLAGRA
jgi:Asp/Glu/hydantoin racemase